MFDVPEDFTLVLKGRGDQWVARLVPDGHTASKWSPPVIEAKARTPEDAFTCAVAKCQIKASSE